MIQTRCEVIGAVEFQADLTNSYGGYLVFGLNASRGKRAADTISIGRVGPPPKIVSFRFYIAIVQKILARQKTWRRVCP